MKKLLGLVLSLFAVSSVAATTHTSKTFLMPRDHNANLAMEYTTFHKQMRDIDSEKFGASIQAVPFYQASVNDEDLGKYFGIKNRNASNRTDDYIYVDNSIASAHISGTRMLLEGTTAPASRLSDQIQFRPTQESYGLRLDWHQNLDKLINGLYLEINMPIVHVQHSLGYSSTSGSTGAVTQFSVSAREDTYNTTAYSVADYLTGNITNAATTAAQVALSHYKIHNGQDETGIADINFVLGYNLLYKEDKHIGLNVIFTIPTGNTPEGIYRWEPVVGNGGHFALGLGFDSAFEFWKSGNKSFDVSLAMNYRYLFESTEKRTLDFNYATTTDFGTDSGAHAMWGPYMLGGSRGDTSATPLANFLTQDLDVTPGSQFDGLLMISFNWGNWTFDMGYELYAKANEDVDLKNTWSTNSYGIAHTNWNTTNAFLDGTTSVLETIYRGASATTYGAGYDLSNITIEQADLLTASAETPAQLTHKLLAGIGWAANNWKYPLLIGIGGSYEFASDNSVLEVWALWAKLGISF